MIIKYIKNNWLTVILMFIAVIFVALVWVDILDILVR